MAGARGSSGGRRGRDQRGGEEEREREGKRWWRSFRGGHRKMAWEESSGENLLQIQLLTALKNFVVALGYQSPLCYNMLLPILQSGLFVNSPDELLEDSILLWEATVSHSPSMVPQLLGLPRLVEILNRSFDHVKVAANIIEGYILLGGNDFLNMHACTVSKLPDFVVDNINDKGLLPVIPVVDLLLQIDNVTSIQRKAYGLALSIILTLTLPQVLDKLDQILSSCTSFILGGSEDLSEEESSSDNMSSAGPQFPSKEYRKRQINLSDPVHQSSLENSVRENLQTCAALRGESFSSTIGKMHPAAFAQLKQALNMT